MHFFSVAYILCAVVLAAVAAPAPPKPAPPPKPSSAPAPAPAASSASKAHAPDQFAPLKIVNETLPHIGIEDEAHPKSPHGSCVVA